MRSRRLQRWIIAYLALSPILPFLVYRVSIWHRRAEISRLGGSTVIGAPLWSYEMTNDRRCPQIVRRFCSSKPGAWVLDQLPVVYSVDLRGVDREEDVESILHVARRFGSVVELTFYQSAVTDDQLEYVAEHFPKVVRLKINETAITDTGITHLHKLPELKLVNAQRTLLTENAVPDLASIRRLKVLNIAETGITSVEPIREAHPMCTINSQLVTRTRSSDYYRTAGS